MANKKHVSHAKSVSLVNGSPKLPTSGDVMYGEIAINYKEGYETISLRNDADGIVRFSSDEYYTAQKLGSGFTGENSANTVTQAIEDIEEITAAALNDLEARKLDVSAYTPVDLTNYYTKSETSGATELSTAFGGYYNKTAIDTKLGSAFTGANSAKTITEGIEDIELVTSRAFNDLNNRKLDASAYTPTDLSNYYNKQEVDARDRWTSGSGTNSAVLKNGSNAANGTLSVAEGYNTQANNMYEHASGRYNVSSHPSESFGDSGNTLFSVGNGDSNTRHNAFEIRQNGDIYIVNKDGNDVKLQDEIGNITVDQVLDDSVSASTNPVSSKAVYKAVTDNELVWTNAFVTVSGAVSSHTSNTTIHVTAADKTAWNAKADTSDIPSVTEYADSVKYNETNHHMEFYHGTTGGTKVYEFDASPFIIDGMVQNVEIKDVTGSGTCLVVSFNTDAGKQDINIPISDIFDANNYYNKTAIDGLVGSGFTSSSITQVIIENEEITAAALNDLEANKLDASAYTPSNYYTKSETSGATELSTAFNGKTDTATTSALSGVVTGHTADTTIHLTSTEKNQLHTHDNKTYLDGITGSVGTMAYENASSYSSATEVNTALGNKANSADVYTKSETSGATELATAFNGKTDTATTSALNDVVTGHTADTTIHLTSTEKGQLHTHSNKTYLDGITGSVGTMAYENASSYSSATQVSTALGDKADKATTIAGYGITDAKIANQVITLGANSVTVSSATQVNTALGDKADNSSFTAHTASTVHMTTTEKTNLDSLATNIAAISGITSTKVSNWDSAATNSHTHSNKTYLDGITGSVGTMAYQNASSYSSATQVNTALSGKSNTGHTHSSNEVTSMSGYSIAASGTAITTADTLNQAIGKLEKQNVEIVDYIEEKELAIAAALTDLDEKIGDIESILATI